MPVLEFGAVLPHGDELDAKFVDLRQHIAKLEEDRASLRDLLTAKDGAMKELEEKYRECELVVAQLKSHIECHKVLDAFIKTRNDVVSKMDKEINAASANCSMLLHVVYGGDACAEPGKYKRKRMVREAEMARE